MNHHIGSSQLFEAIAQNLAPHNTDLLPHIAARLHKKKSVMTTLRAKPVLTMLLVLLALVLATSIAYAIGKVTGYIPGIGLVDQSKALRVLVEPVTVKRDGITLTVEQVVLSADKTVVVYKVEGIPAEAYESEGGGEGASSIPSSITVPIKVTPEGVSTSVDKQGICFLDENLSLPDGILIQLQTGAGNGWTSGFENRNVFGPVPAEVNEAVFLVSCISGTAPGKLPENWEVPLRFMPAPSGMNILPAVDVNTQQPMKLKAP